MCDGRWEGGGEEEEEVFHGWRQMSSLLPNTERLVTPPNTNTDARRYAAWQLRRHMPQSAVCARRESSDLYAGCGRRLYGGALTLRLACQSQSPGDLSFSLSACSPSWFGPSGWLNDRPSLCLQPCPRPFSIYNSCNHTHRHPRAPQIHAAPRPAPDG